MSSVFIGRHFAEALTEGLRRAAPFHGAPRRTGPAPVRRPTPASALLREHAESILHEFATALPLSLDRPDGPDRHLCSAFLARARHALETAADPLPAEPPPRGPAREPGLTPHQELIAATLLIECAARRLPAGPPGEEAVRALGRAIRGHADHWTQASPDGIKDT
ncbi:hypothetical protein [Streptomyces sp. CC208A]|uniref:hypothetical protein n=1 Tax=Streptomyces sp. CC208A TaxID=3044573 RepID=UPI0024A93CB9|nr:hypothetical protein [Streptomyces sp. CC208A]